MYVAVMVLPVLVATFVFVWRLRDDLQKERAFKANLTGESDQPESFIPKTLQQKPLLNIPLS